MNLVSKLIEHSQKRSKQTAIEYFNKGLLYSLNWEQVRDRVEQLYNAFLSLGLQKGERVAIYSNTCKEWGFIDLATMASGATTVPIYHSSQIEDVEYILSKTKPKVLFIENESLFNKIKDNAVLKDIESVVLIHGFDGMSEDNYNLKQLSDLSREKRSLEEAAKQIKDDDVATIIFTSGTSGTPKGAVIRHRQIESCVSEVFPLLGVTDADKTLTFLPYTHVLGRMELWGHYFCGYCLGYAESFEKLKKNLLVVKPTVIVGVPRIFEKIYFGIQAQVEISKLKKGIFKKAMEIGSKNQKLRSEKRTPSWLQALKSQLAYRLVFSNIQEKLGGNIRFAVSGGAPLEPEISRFFAACGIPILEGYGLTETTGPIFVNTLFDHKLGCVGKAVGDVKVKFDSDGEILVKSKKVMEEYLDDAEETKKSFDEEGYYRTGDIGELDEEGFLKITDRKKDLIKTAGGKFVAPQKLQNLFATRPLISHVHIHGDKEKYVVALITLDKDKVRQYQKDNNLASKDYTQLVQSKTLDGEVKSIVRDVNSELASFETIKRFAILDHDFSIEDGQLTPSLKMKRKVIDQMYKDQIQGLYQ